METNNIRSLLDELDDVTLDAETVYRYRDLIGIVMAILKQTQLIE